MAAIAGTDRHLRDALIPNWVTEWGTYLVALLIPFQIVIPGFPFLITGCTILSALLFAASFVNAVFEGRVARPSANIVVGMLLLVSLLSVVNSDNVLLSWDRTLCELIWVLTIYFNVAWNIRTKRHLERLLCALGLGVAFLCIFSILDVVTKRGTIEWLASSGLLPYLSLNPSQSLTYPTDTALGTFFNADYLAAFLLFPSCLAFGLVMWGTGKSKWVGGAILLLTGFTILLTHGRGAAMALLSALLLMTLAYLARERRRITPVIVTVMLIVCLGLLLSPYAGGVWTRLGELLGGEKWTMDNLRYSFEVRADLLRAGMENFSHHPILGYGYEYSDWSIDVYYPGGGSAVFAPGHCHNWYVETLVTSGVVGLLAWLVLVVAAMWSSFAAFLKAGDRTIRWVAMGLVGALAAFLVDGWFNDSYREPKVSIIFWTAIALAVVLRNIGEASQAEKSANRSEMMPSEAPLATARIPAMAIPLVLVLLNAVIALSVVYLAQPTPVYAAFAGMLMLGSGMASVAKLAARR